MEWHTSARIIDRIVMAVEAKAQADGTRNRKRASAKQVRPTHQLHDPSCLMPDA
jgi:hypothetical protein